MDPLSPKRTEAFGPSAVDATRPTSSHARIEGMINPPTDGLRRAGVLPELTKAMSFSHVTTSKDSVSKEGTVAAPSEEETEAFKQAMWAGQANILVTVRLRPRLSHDRDQEEIVKVLDHKVVVVLDAPASESHQPPQPQPTGGRQHHTSHRLRQLRHLGKQPASASPTARSTSFLSRSREKRYAFDYVFTPEDGQQTVYAHTTKFLIHGVLNGFNATVFAYGCTGAGKTYTMLGTPDQPGIMALTLDDLFQNIERVHADANATVEYKVMVSFLEVYNENIRDLLAAHSSLTSSGTGNSNASTPATTPGSGAPPAAPTPVTSPMGEFLDLREDPARGPVVAGLSEIEAFNAADVMRLLRRGNKNRSQEATAANAVSSRSHAVLQVLVEQRDKNSKHNDDDDGSGVRSTVKLGKLSLVDLAGSERAAVTQNRGLRLLEGANINRSLLALGNCINALGEKGAGGGNGFVPYRDSKLTRLLKDSLGGNCRTVMIANINLSASSFEETLNTLKYANRAKNIKTTVTRNVMSVDHHITEYVGMIATLKDEIASLKKQLVLQQDQRVAPAVSVPLLPGQVARSTNARDAWVNDDEDGPEESDNHSNNNNNNGNHDDHDEATRQSTVQKARIFIMECFQERLQLKRALLELDQQATSSLSAQVDLTGFVSRLQQENDLSTAITKPMQLEPNESQNPETNDSIYGTKLAVDQDPERLRRLADHMSAAATKRQQLQHRLRKNEHLMDDFRAAIEQSPLLRNELQREVLLLEFRIGGLQVDKMELQVGHDQKEQEIRQLRLQLCGAGGSATPVVAAATTTATTAASLVAADASAPSITAATSPLAPPLSPVNDTLIMTSRINAAESMVLMDALEDSTMLPQLAQEVVSERKPVDDSLGPEDCTHLPEVQLEVHSSRSSSGFFEELKERLHDRRTTASPVPRAHQQDKGQTTPQQYQQPQQHAQPMSSRRQWSLHLNNATLPYIRLRKKSNGGGDRADMGVKPMSVAPAGQAPHVGGTVVTTAPYLKVLKQRRKLDTSTIAGGNKILVQQRRL
ncbi:TPA: hypothetical protein N0F65_006603 [Lagenidium giganteum]|uniref:Kinesin motor domain-containing protein n=1 Tax=Lagenidium giganteum TaxID=4803 RepID=A0AAV2Z765_9STRA|nr:TPA: hypothetical protein N0F65_006603 [Lagenidium giganteum]